MKLSEFDKIRKYLPDDVEITINGNTERVYDTSYHKAKGLAEAP